MSFGYTPDDGPPRLIRYVEPGSLPPNVLCTLDAANNLLRVDRSLLMRMPELERAIVLKTTRASIEVSFDNDRPKLAA